MAKVSGAHTDLGPELRRLAQAILDGVDPAVRAAVMVASGGGEAKCQQVWCPFCALAAVVNGEQHPLVTVIADHSVALLDVIRAIVDDMGTSVAESVSESVSESGAEAATPTPEGDPSGGGPSAEAPVARTNGNGTAKTHYQAIPVTLQD